MACTGSVREKTLSWMHIQGLEALRSLVILGVCPTGAFVRNTGVKKPADWDVTFG